jgi:hypothetical protein
MRLAFMWTECDDPADRTVTGETDHTLAGPTRCDKLESRCDEWAQEDLVRRLCLALSIATRAIAFLGDDGYRDEQDPEGSFGPDKPFAETAMLLHVASAVAGRPQVKASIEEVSVRLAAKARSHRTACAIVLHPTICLQLAMPHILLSRLGLPDSRFDRLLALSTGSSAHNGQEVVPHRALERIWIRSVWQGTPPGDALDAAVSTSALNFPPDLLWGTREDAYAHTHALMYFTAFGYSTRPLPRQRPEVLAESSALLARSLLLEDYDLAAEVLMAWPLTSAQWSPAAAFGFRVLAELEDTVGFLPAKNGMPERLAHLAGDERTKSALAAAYHTAYVMGMLCALALRPGNAPPAVITGPSARAVVVDELLGRIPDVDTPWRQTFHRLGPMEQGALGPFLLEMGLVSAARRHDFASMGTLLAFAVDHGLANTPVCSQSADLLRRMSVCANGNAE